MVRLEVFNTSKGGEAMTDGLEIINNFNKKQLENVGGMDITIKRDGLRCPTCGADTLTCYSNVWCSNPACDYGDPITVAVNLLVKY